ncbi:MAG: YbjN domain-containing protein [Alistipes sp.]|nr:YbjN domain-containing protein [Alistipes sp.]
MRHELEILDEIKLLSDDGQFIAWSNWWHFSYRGHRMVYQPNVDSQTLRICIPHFDNVANYDPEVLLRAINRVNREVRYVKIFILDNGSISLNYDHRCECQADSCAIAKHILETLIFAAEYLKNALF